MLYLIELYDSSIPINNYLSCRLLEPDEMVLLTADGEEDLAPARERFENFRQFFGLKTKVTFCRCRPRDLAGMEENMSRFIRYWGEENCVIDVIGGDETLLVAAGMCAVSFPSLRIVSLRGSAPVLIRGEDPKGEIGRTEASLTVRDVISMAAGELVRCGHADWRDLDEDTMALIPVMFGIYLDNRSSWPSFVYYLQGLNSMRYRVREGAFSGPAEITVNPVTGRRVRADLQIINALSSAGIVSECRLTQSVCRLTFSRPGLVRFLCDSGSWLELFVYSVLRGSGLFGDIEIDPVISWDNDRDDLDTVNEVDLIAMRGIVPVFISCKSGIPGNDAVNEILTITRRFGNRRARAVLVTACDPERDAPALLRRAADSGVSVVRADRSDVGGMTGFFRDLVAEL